MNVMNKIALMSIATLGIAAPAFAQTATGVVNLVSINGSGPSQTFTYDIVLDNTGTTNIESFWYAWIPLTGTLPDNYYNFLPSNPSGETSPTGWAPTVVGPGIFGGGYSIRWDTSSNPLTPGSTDNYGFTTKDNFATITGPDTIAFVPVPVGTSYIYSGVPEDSSTGSLTVEAGSSTPVTSGTWNVAGGGSWTASANWLNGFIPQNAGNTANFDNAITAPSTVTLDSSQTVGTVNFNSSNTYTLATGTAGTLILNNGSSSAAINDLGGKHVISAPLVLNSSAVITVANAGDSLLLSGGVSGTGGLTVAGSGKVSLSGNASNTVTSLAINSGSTLDLTSSSLDINYGGGTSPLSTITSDLAAGSITSSTLKSGFALGYLDGTLDGPNSVAAGNLLVKPALIGDTNLDGTVNLTDLLSLLNSYGQTGRDWAQGDVNYDGTVNLTDLLALLNNYGQSSGGIATQVVPEPATGGLLVAGLVGVLARRRRA
jgi:fibronectin-binding autotransporter adhesin